MLWEMAYELSICLCHLKLYKQHLGFEVIYLWKASQRSSCQRQLNFSLQVTLVHGMPLPWCERSIGIYLALLDLLIWTAGQFSLDTIHYIQTRLLNNLHDKQFLSLQQKYDFKRLLKTYKLFWMLMGKMGMHSAIVWQLCFMSHCGWKLN